MITKFHPMNVRFTPSEFRRLKKYAKQNKQKMAHVVRELVIKHCVEWTND